MGLLKPSSPKPETQRTHNLLGRCVRRLGDVHLDPAPVYEECLAYFSWWRAKPVFPGAGPNPQQPNVGALIIRMGSGGTLSYNYNKERQNPSSNY